MDCGAIVAVAAGLSAVCGVAAAPKRLLIPKLSVPTIAIVLRALDMILNVLLSELRAQPNDLTITLHVHFLPQ